LQSLIQLLESLGGGVSPETKALLNSFSAPVGFDRDLEVGSTGDDVVALQVYLNAHGYTLASSGPGSPGNETSRFGGLTRAALAKFQADNGITPSVGYFGLKTRAFVNAHP
jgi:peptidoglycan hydrolase-like protein with peptidoglycan-binding domain